MTEAAPAPRRARVGAPVERSGPPPLLVVPHFSDFYAAHLAEVCRAVALTTGDPALARDAVDEAMVRAYERWATVGLYRNPEGWVYRVAVNWAYSRLRRMRRSVLRATTPDRPVWDAPVDPDLGAALAALPRRHREVLVLRFHRDFTVPEVAAALRIPEGTVKSRLHRALADLRTHLDDGRQP